MKKIALVVLDQKTVKLTFAYAEMGKYFYICDELEESVDLGRDIPNGAIIKNTTTNDVVKILKMYKRICESQKIEEIYAFVTQFVSRAKNQVSFVDELESSTGFKFKVLTEEEELNAIYLSSLNTLDIPRAVVINVENDCTNIVKYFRRNVLFSISIPIGASSLAELFATPDINPVEVHQQMVDFFKMQLEEYGVNKQLLEGYKFICVGNMADALFKLYAKKTKYPINVEHNFVLSQEKFEDIYQVIETLDVDSSKKIKGISNERADIFAGAMSIFKAVFDLQDEFDITFSQVGLKEGLLFTNVVPLVPDKPLLDITTTRLECLQEKCGLSIKNGAKVSELATNIFKQLKVLHKLSRTYLKSLKVAAFLYRCGEAINFHNMRKNCFNVISNSMIFGISHKELLLAAFIAENVDPDAFNLSELIRYKAVLDEDDFDSIVKLSAILKIAIGLDITGNGAVTDMSCDVLGDSVIMKTCSETDVSFEIRYALHGAKYFKKAFNKYLEIL